MTGYSDNSEDSSQPPSLSGEGEQRAEAAVGKALAAIESGQQPESVLTALTAGLPAHLQEQVRRRVGQELEKRKERRQQQAAEQQRQSKEQKDRGQGGALAAFSMAVAAKLIGQRTLERIAALVRSRPDVQQSIRIAGQQLYSHGVRPDVQAMPEEELGRIAPSAAQGRQQDRERGI